MIETLLTIVAKENRYPQLRFAERTFFFIGTTGMDDGIALIFEIERSQMYAVQADDLVFMSRNNELEIVA